MCPWIPNTFSSLSHHEEIREAKAWDGDVVELFRDLQSKRIPSDGEGLGFEWCRVRKYRQPIALHRTL